MEELLKEMLGKRPEELEGETLKLFEAIMKIADERDKLKAENRELEKQIDLEYVEENYIEKSKVILKSKVEEIRDKAEVMDYYTLPDVIEDLNKLLEE